MITRSGVGRLPRCSTWGHTLASVLWWLVSSLTLALAMRLDAAESTFAGDWKCECSTLSIMVEGQHVTALSTGPTRLISGTISADGRTLDAQWSQAPSFSPPRDAGRFVLTLAADGASFTGRWGYDIKTDGGPLNGRRVGVPTTSVKV